MHTHWHFRLIICIVQNREDRKKCGRKRRAGKEHVLKVSEGCPLVHDIYLLLLHDGIA